MPGILKAWPPWPQLVESKGELKPGNARYKQEIFDKYGAEAICQSWLNTCKALEALTAEIAAKRTAIIPVLALDEILNMSEQKKEELKGVGCFVVRDVVPRSEAAAWFRDLKQYVADNKDEITGWPLETPVILDIFHSPSQQAARSHPNVLKMTRELNAFWHDESGVTSPEQLSYADGVRIRTPTISVNICPHIDAGSLARWADPSYRSVYSSIWSGEPEKHDPYNLTLRKEANPKLFPGPAHSSILRTFQGWLALTEAGPGDGSLMVYPNVKAVLAYMLLRPFFAPPENEKDLMNAKKWTMDLESDWFPGTFSDDSQLLSSESHPHLRLEECLVSIPKMYPGDTVFWHTDLCHAVEIEHNGTNDASVVYIGAAPTTPANILYIKDQWARFKNGKPPGDFEHGKDESTFKGYSGENGILGGEAGRQAAGAV
ncbi:DUF1479-domain-containing protein [Stipitochalara longipes BDJ]|nr:DUF1479-domain-containing protein [Stipitochalara longipes BDJ]